MRYQSSEKNLTENVAVGQLFPPGATVTVTVKNMSTGGSVTLTSGATTEITINSEVSLYTWNTSNITTQPTSFTQYAVIFESTTGAVGIQKVVKGGYPDQIADASYDKAVHIDTVGGTAGTAFPIGTPGVPSSNITDARTIADARGLTVYHIRGAVTLNADHEGWTFIGESSTLNDSVACAGYNVNSSTFQNITVSGAIGGTVPKNITCRDARLSAVTSFDGVVFDSGILTSFGVASTGEALLKDAKVLTFAATLNANGCSKLLWSGASGVVTLTNFTAGAGLLMIQANSLVLTMDASCTAGLYAIGGDGILYNSGSMTELFDEFRSKAVDEEIVDSATDDIPGKTLGMLFPFVAG